MNTSWVKAVQNFPLKQLPEHSLNAEDLHTRKRFPCFRAPLRPVGHHRKVCVLLGQIKLETGKIYRITYGNLHSIFRGKLAWEKCSAGGSCSHLWEVGFLCVPSSAFWAREVWKHCWTHQSFAVRQMQQNKVPSARSASMFVSAAFPNRYHMFLVTQSSNSTSS